MGRLRDGFEAISGTVGLDRFYIELPTSNAITFDFQSPTDGEEAGGDMVDLRFDLVFPDDSTDLESVSVNGEVFIQYDPRRPIPVKKRLPVTPGEVQLVDGEIQISVTLFSKIEPVRAAASPSDAPP